MTIRKTSFLLTAASFQILLATAQKGDYPIQPVPFTQVHMHDEFWKPRMELNANVTIPYVLQKCRETGRVDNFLKAAGKKPVGNITEFPFDDTDIYKVIEGASYAMQVKKNPTLEKQVDSLIEIIWGAQERDGYLYTFRTMNPPKLHPWISPKRWEKDPDLSHELYNAGHLYEAAVAHYLATGKKSLLNIAIKNADLLVKDFGAGKAEYWPGHQVVEMGLARMYRVTGKKEYLDLAKFFLDIRGNGKIKGSQYSQSHKPVTDQHEAVGHAVRAAYMYTGMADVAALTGNKDYIKAIEDIWNDVVQKKIYLTGGIGATGAGEAFGAPYQLPNMAAYAETCASIANVYWNSRMFLMQGDAKYIDVMERVLYNGLLSGISQDGKRFFYPNPLASMGQHQRSAWFSCACCISNVTRFLPSVPGYVYAKNKNDLYVNLFTSSKADIDLPAGKVSVDQQTAYPWSGKVDFTITPLKASNFTLRIRIPGWARQEAVPSDLYQFADKTEKPIVITINGKQAPYKTEKGYALFTRTWSKGDKISVNFPMEVEKVLAHENVVDDKGRFALQKGPIVYCLEGPDNTDNVVQNIMVSDKAELKETYKNDLLNGVMVLTANGSSTSRQLNTDALLKKDQEVKAIPYYSWNNRGAGEMVVWIPYVESAARPKPAPTVASKSKVTSSLQNSRMEKALNDQYEPGNSQDHSAVYLHWWPKKATTEWVQYDFDGEQTLSESSVYWFDDGPSGGCRIPASWKVFYKDGENWLPVKNTTDYTITKDKYDTIKFEPVKTKALRIEVKLPQEHATGMHEWIVK
ncbi:MAG: glycoside hydrolase family 127 protein [Chitinophagaceae bacterium]|nr:MAG: glycoside hydrolase family 127 protein [Chitinophagaceae bacterium]